MNHHIFSVSDKYPIALLFKPTAFNKTAIAATYVNAIEAAGLKAEDVIAFNLDFDSKSKVSAKTAKDYLNQLLPMLESIGTKYLYVTDSTYFKTLTGQAKSEPHLGYVLPCKIKNYEHMFVVLGLNYQALIYNPDLNEKLTLSINTLVNHRLGKYTAIGTGIIHSAQYPESVEDIEQALESLHQYPSLSCDIEGFSLRFNEAGVGSIAFAWDQHNGIAFACDYTDKPIVSANPCAEVMLTPGRRQDNPVVKALLKRFFTAYKGELTFHSASYDVKALIYNIWMSDLLDAEGMLEGLDTLTNSIHDTKIIAYLATNSTAGNSLSLKELAHEFAGNWAVEEIKDITYLPKQKLLQYNLVDALSTHYVRNKYYPIMVADNQEDLYKGLMLDSLKLLIQTELTGMPLNPTRVQEVKAELLAIQAHHLDVIQNNGLIKALNLLLQTNAMEAANAKLKTKQHPLSKFADVEFNPNSGPQLQRLLYEQMGLPIIDLTDKKQPATGADTIAKLRNHVSDPLYQALLDSLIAYGNVNKILSTFIPAFERGIAKNDGWLWLHGNFNIGGTVSGRLSSSDPNLQNLPANSTYGKLIKSCFQAPNGKIFAGADFNSLEDYISALTTKDPNKLKVYTDGFDGHCLRAASYFREQLQQIDMSDPKSVNSIKKSHPELRQLSKVPTFALTYQGTWHTLVNNLGLDPDKAKSIEASYHELYKVSDEYVQKRLEQASKDGYIVVAFGLRVRTPLLAQVVFGGDKVPYEAAAEGRTAGNAMGQSYGLLNNRAAVDFMKKVWKSPYRYRVFPVALIHDAIYIIFDDDAEVAEWVNRELIVSMQWQELPEIAHDTVKLGAALDLFWPSWAYPTTLPNNANQETIKALCSEAKKHT